MDSYKDLYIDGKNTLEDAKNAVRDCKEEGLCFYLLQQSAEKFLKSLLMYYGVHLPQECYIDTLIEQLEKNTTVKLPPFKERLIELSFVPYEGGCASSTIYEKRPESFIETLEELKRFVEEELLIS